MVGIGQRLYEKRVQKKLSLEEVAHATKIKARFLAAIEKGEYSKLPSPAYAQGFVRNYAAYLGLPKTETTALFKREFDEKKAYKVLPDALTKTEEFPINRIRIQQSLILAGGVIVIFFLYLFIQYRSTFTPPPLSISTPKQNVTVPEEVTVSGKTDDNSTIMINGEPASVNSNGEFQKVIVLFPGKTTIRIKAKNKFGKETLIEREVVVK